VGIVDGTEGSEVVYALGTFQTTGHSLVMFRLHGAESFSRSQQLFTHVVNSQHFMEPDYVDYRVHKSEESRAR
jgi:hypothetical protein